ncbi:hypothetical protein [Frigoribacterium sp. Leaf263]|uniref:hypothetical protein n=1 Tax=Frigoribacterium sp. Leaf263 TaxID=1736313 RepID=UPI0012E15A55|nr:hypothetical protein [Frigoribacterium sp. Leaf263]
MRNEPTPAQRRRLRPLITLGSLVLALSVGIPLVILGVPQVVAIIGGIVVFLIAQQTASRWLSTAPSTPDEE